MRHHAIKKYCVPYRQFCAKTVNEQIQIVHYFSKNLKLMILYLTKGPAQNITFFNFK